MGYKSPEKETSPGLINVADYLRNLWKESSNIIPRCIRVDQESRLEWYKYVLDITDDLNQQLNMLHCWLLKNHHLRLGESLAQVEEGNCVSIGEKADF